MSAEVAGAPRDICERTFEFAVRVVRVCQRLDETPGVGRTLGRQLLRAGTAIAANCEEARTGQSRPDFVSKNAIALKEARETVYWLRLLTATDLFPRPVADPLRTEAEELARILGAIIVSTKKAGMKGMLLLLACAVSLPLFLLYDFLLLTYRPSGLGVTGVGA